MPVTLKLSKQFYEKFGDQVANEFVDAFNQVDATYRSDLKEMNESNFARFDAKQEARFAEFETRFTRFEARVDARFAQFETRFAQFEAKMETRFAQCEASVGTKMEQGFKEQARFMLLGWGTMFAAILAAALALK